MLAGQSCMSRACLKYVRVIMGRQITWPVFACVYFKEAVQSLQKCNA
jgi:hypothetical protein